MSELAGGRRPKGLLAQGDGARSGESNHAVQRYEAEQTLVERIGRFLADGVAAGEALLIVATPERLAGFARVVETRGHDLARLEERGRVTRLDAEETLSAFMREGLPDPDAFFAHMERALATARGRAGTQVVRAYSELVEALQRKGACAAALYLEALWGELRTRERLVLPSESPLDGLSNSSELPSQQASWNGQTTSDGEHRRAREQLVTLLQRQARALRVEAEERRLVEARLYLEREEADRFRDQILAMLGHELRNPLSPMVLALHLARRRLAEGRSVERELAIIGRQVEQIAGMLDELLDVSRLARGQLELYREPLFLADALTGAVKAAEPAILSRGHDLDYRPPPEDLQILGDRLRLVLVFRNLLRNAARYTPAGGHITLSAEVEGGEVRVRVRDDGEGITADLLPHIFEPFVQAPQALDRPRGGLGLGLSVARRVIALHGGSIEARSEGPGRGAELVVHLPVLHAWPGRGGEPRSLRMLIADDNEEAAVTLGQTVALWGHHATVVHDGHSALQAIARLRPEVALMDIGLPGLDGYEVARRVRADQLPVHLVAISGYSGPEAERRARAAGFDACLARPLEPERLYSLLERLSAEPGAPEESG